VTPSGVSGVSSWMLTTALEGITCLTWSRATIPLGVAIAGAAVGIAVARVAKIAKAEEKIADFILMLVWFGLGFGLGTWYQKWEIDGIMRIGRLRGLRGG